MVQPFNRAGEDAVISRLVYDFSRVGLEGVSGSVLFVHGWGRVLPSTKNKVPNENEFDADLQWRPTWSFLNGSRHAYGMPVSSNIKGEETPSTNTARFLTATSVCSED